MRNGLVRKMIHVTCEGFNKVDWPHSFEHLPRVGDYIKGSYWDRSGGYPEKYHIVAEVYKVIFGEGEIEIQLKLPSKS